MTWTAWSVLAALSMLAAACTSAGAQRIVGPDGSAMGHVHCGSDQGTCFRLAGELCPSGYDLQPALTGYDGNFLVRCRAPRATAATATCVASGSLAAAKPRDAWPPSSEPWPVTYPWSPPETSAAVQAAPAAQPAKAPVEIDLGY
ncbi:MAG: hypothetical protein EOO73_03480 [Myxococcales bacterium]|nr:MAG: hypothetical protein EOO73_03480 [Myxococcales bacterium]